MSIAAVKYLQQLEGPTTYRMPRKPSPDILKNQHSELLDSADPVDVVRRLVQQMVGQRLPSERDLAASLKISRPNLRNILAMLQKEGLVEARPKSGTYVIDDRAGLLRRIVLLIDSDLKLSDDPFILSLVDALQRNIQAMGARCLIERTSSKGGERPALEDGAMTLGLAGRDILANLRPEDPPVVGLLLDQQTRPNRKASVFQLEDREAGRTAARRLLDKGCKEVLFLGRTDIPASRERMHGVEEGLADSGVPARLVSTHLNYAAGVKLGHELDLREVGRPVGLIATNDWLALGLRAGLRDVSDDSSTRDVFVVSFDGLAVTADPRLGIDSLKIPIDDIASDAVDEIRRLQRSPASAGRVVRYFLQ